VLYLELLVFGVCVGVISGLLGIGGGIVLVPGLMLLFGFKYQEACGTTLAAMVPPIGIFAALVYYQHNYVKLPVAGAVAVGIMAGAYLGARLLPYVRVEWLSLAFGGLLLYLGLRLVFGFVLGQELPKHVAAMPAGLAAAVLMAAAWLRGKRPALAKKLPPPDGHTEYHI
jgi:uncharacterized membrane protein YfcA